MAKCLRCGASGITLKLDTFSLCPGCQVAAHQEYERKITVLERSVNELQAFHDKYVVIPDADAEAARILTEAEAKAQATVEKAKKAVDTEKKKKDKVSMESALLIRRAKADIADMLVAAGIRFLGDEMPDDPAVLLAASEVSHKDDSSSERSRKDNSPSERSQKNNGPMVQTEKLSPAKFLREAGKGYIAFDLETTGLDSRRDEIIEIGAAYIVDRTETRRFDTLIRPTRLIPAAASAVNGITDRMVSDAPTIGEVLPQFMDFIEGFPIIAHNANFDVSFLAAAAEKLGISASLRYGDSLQIARQYFPDAPNHKLGTICERIGYKSIKAHRAYDDALAVAHIVTACLG